MKPTSLWEDEAFLHTVQPPEEDRHLLTSMPWKGGYRWFRSPNVIPIERWRRQQQQKQPPEAA
jgi:hypothetical protein